MTQHADRKTIGKMLALVDFTPGDCHRLTRILHSTMICHAEAAPGFIPLQAGKSMVKRG
jgi:hypothetical protein